MMLEPFVCESYETAKDDKAGENEVKYAWVTGEQRSVLGY